VVVTSFRLDESRALMEEEKVREARGHCLEAGCAASLKSVAADVTGVTQRCKDILRGKAIWDRKKQDDGVVGGGQRREDYGTEARSGASIGLEARKRVWSQLPNQRQLIT
jgi:hypothetical protein